MAHPVVAAAGTERELAQSALPAVDHVHVEVSGTKLRAVCTRALSAPVILEAPVPAHQAHGDVALVVKKGADVELAGVAVRKN